MSHYKVGAWNGIPNYECSYCQFSTVNEGKMLMHLQQRHPTAISKMIPEKKKPSPPIVWDAAGRLIVPNESKEIETAGEDTGKTKQEVVEDGRTEIDATDIDIAVSGNATDG